jgi:hypothetical protein
MSEAPDKPNRKRATRTAAIVAVLFAAYMGAYEATGDGAGTFVGNAPHRHFVNWMIPSVAEPLFAPGDWIDNKARQLFDDLPPTWLVVLVAIVTFVAGITVSLWRFLR